MTPAALTGRPTRVRAVPGLTGPDLDPPPARLPHGEPGALVRGPESLPVTR
ncbi:hypothetical protein ACFRI7_27990 [Streptomyces sp. NPDC056716]|uniref:hypothetical protein n=1 Tax=unclassified Streptomyces TaxID=2593676 RepID=UPI003689B5CF